jgi:hypothetical protein
VIIGKPGKRIGGKPQIVKRHIQGLAQIGKVIFNVLQYKRSLPDAPSTLYGYKAVIPINTGV